MQKIVAGKQLWNYDNLEPAEKKIDALSRVQDDGDHNGQGEEGPGRRRPATRARS